MLTNQRLSGNQATDLVFPSPKGRAIDDHNFSQRVWWSMLSATDITPYCPPYALRHTFATWGKRNDMTDEQIAYWLGHKTTRMVREHYRHLDEQPFVPEFEISTNDESYDA
ncbi:MAG: tyrosine-type recombinase/integrase [Cyanobacteria bacterium P01_A01_bin.123]